MSFFITDAMAAGAGNAAPADGSAYSFIMLAAIFVLFYFMLIRPQNKRAKEHRDLIGNLKKGDEIVTTGGIIAKVVSLDEQYIKVSPADGLEFTMQRNSVNTVLPKGTMKSL